MSIEHKKFSLSDNFIEKYKTKKPPFGFNGLGELTYFRTYSRLKEDGQKEQWWETIQRVVEGTYNIQKDWIEKRRLVWNSHKAQYSAQEMYDRMFTMKLLSGGRGLWANGTDIITKKGLTEALFNCVFISSDNIKKSPRYPFTFTFDMLMCGCGVGFDTKGAGLIEVKPQIDTTSEYIIPDTREGWVESLGLLIDSFFSKSSVPIFDYSKIREAGLPIKTFGGTSSGPAPLKLLHEEVTAVLQKEAGKPISERAIVDIFNMIGKAVIAGNVRRSALLAAGDGSSDFLDLKDYDKNPDREGHGWASNNSVLATLGMDYTEIAERIKKNGEPGLLWLENAHNYKRMGDPDTGPRKDDKTAGANPCGEIFLNGTGEACNLVEVFPDRHEDINDFIKSLKYAYLYSKTITLLDTNWPELNESMLRNRRVGTSVSGIAQFLANNDLKTLKTWLRTGYDALVNYDQIYSDWFAIPRSIRLSTNKPSGSISLLAGATPGIHYPESRFYTRRMRLSKDSLLLKPLKKAGYDIEPAFGQEDSTVVISVPVDVGENVRVLRDVPMWEQLELAAFMQEHWADNAVSATITFDPETEGDQIKHALNYFQYKLKGISFLPRVKGGAYRQMPYEEITEEQYITDRSNLKTLNFKKVRGEEAEVEKFCNNDVCEII